MISTHFFLISIVLYYLHTDPNNPEDYSNGVRKEITRKWVPSKCDYFINNIDDNIIEKISLILDDESTNTKAHVTKATDIFRHSAT